MKRDLNIRNEPNVDSLYKPIERRERVFRPLKIPSQLQRDLPFRLKPKSAETTTIKDPIAEKQRVAVVLEPQEKKVRRDRSECSMKLVLCVDVLDRRCDENVHHSLQR